jgi:hypothetical protein
MKRFSPVTYGRDVRVSPQDPKTIYAALSVAAASHNGGPAHDAAAASPIAGRQAGCSPAFRCGIKGPRAEQERARTGREADEARRQVAMSDDQRMLDQPGLVLMLVLATIMLACLLLVASP